MEQFGITGVKKNASGQSILELIIAIPAFIAFTLVLTRVNIAIQSSINNQKYVRAQTLFLTYHSPYYPRVDLRSNAIASAGIYFLGISNETGSSRGNELSPVAIPFLIARNSENLGDVSESGEPTSIGRIRVRNTVALCTEPMVGNGTEAIHSDSLLNINNFSMCAGR